MSVNASRSNLHQSIPNLKSPPSTHRIHNEDNRSGSFPSVNQHHPQNYPGPNYPNTNYHEPNRTYNTTPYQGQNMKDTNNYSGPQHNNYPNNVQHVHSNGQRQETENRYNNAGGGLLREDIVRQSQNARHEEIMRYLSTNNARINEQNRIQDNEMRVSKSDDMLKHPVNHQANDMMRYASSGNIRAHESSKVEIPLYRMKDEEELDMRMANNVRPQKLIDNSDLLKRKQQQQQQQRGPQTYQPNNQYYQHQQYYQQNNSPYSPTYNMQMAQNTQSMQNLTLNQQYPNYPNYHQQNQYYLPPTSQMNSPTSPTYKSPPVAPKPKKTEEPPELPPTSTHPLYSASSQDPPKMAFYPTTTSTSSGKTPRDPWAREEQERQAEARREASRQWQEQQIRELMSLPQRTPQQEEQLRVLQLEREFQRRAMEAAEQDDDDTEKVVGRNVL